VPNTAPAAGNILVGNAGGTAYAPVALSGGCTLSSTGVLTCNGGTPPLSSVTAPTTSVTFTQPSGSTSTFNGTAPASSASAGTAATTDFALTQATGGATTGSATTAGAGAAGTLNCGGIGGSGAGGTNAIGGAGGSCTISAGNGGASGGTAANSTGGNIILLPGTAGTGGSGTAGSAGTVVFPVGSTTIPSLQATGSASNTGFVVTTLVSCFLSAGALSACGVATGEEVGSAKLFLWSSTTQGNGTADTGLSRDSAGVVDIGTGAQGSKAAILQTKRYTVDGGTTLTSGAFTVGAGWGSTASLAITNSTSKDSAAVVTITAGGTGIAANPTLVLTFADGTWTNTPVCSALNTAGSSVIADLEVSARSATAYTWVYEATPTTANTSEITVLCTGT
jgi:hypothetical protein